MQAVVQLGKGFSRSTLDAADTCCSTFENASIPMARAGPEAMPIARGFVSAFQRLFRCGHSAKDSRGLNVDGECPNMSRKTEKGRT